MAITDRNVGYDWLKASQV